MVSEGVPGRLGRYQIIKHLANGGMAQVLLARATGIEGFERHVVVKRIHADRAADPTFVKMFLDEARLAAQLHHNNIVQVHDIGKEQGEYFFAMEYVHGEDLRHVLMKVSKRKQKVPLEHVVMIVTTAAAALHHAHEQRGADRQPLGLVHRDVSPANIILGYDGNLKVVDFGIAKAALKRTEGTQGGSLKGKVAYMAPEHCAGKPVDRRSDVFALGIVLYELTTARRLFKGANDFLTMSAIVQGDYPRPSTHRPGLPAQLEAIILKALARDPADRFQTADEMREALERFALCEDLRPSTSGLARYMRELFGERPEPWLVDDEGVVELSVDFDGSASGVVATPEEAEQHLAIPGELAPTPSAPIVRARKKAASTPPRAASQAPISASALAAAVTPARRRPTLPVPKVAPKLATATPRPGEVPRLATPKPGEVPRLAAPKSGEVPRLATPKPGEVPRLATPRPAEVPRVTAPAPGDVAITPAASATASVQADDASDPRDARTGVAPSHTRDVGTTTPPPIPRPPVLPAPPAAPARIPGDERNGWSPHEKSTSGSGTPLAWPKEEASATSPLPRRTMRYALAAGAATLVVLVIALATRGGGDDTEIAPAAAAPARPAPTERVAPPPPSAASAVTAPAAALASPVEAAPPPAATDVPAATTEVPPTADEPPATREPTPPTTGTDEPAPSDAHVPRATTATPSTGPASAPAQPSTKHKRKKWNADDLFLP